MIIECKSCGRTQKTSLDFFVKLIGGALPLGGFWAWVAYIFAGTGLALPIVISIMTGGVAMLVFKDQIVEWLMNRGYKCPKCGSVDWDA
jgi:hypothetical protein